MNMNTNFMHIDNGILWRNTWRFCATVPPWTHTAWEGRIPPSFLSAGRRPPFSRTIESAFLAPIDDVLYDKVIVSYPSVLASHIVDRFVHSVHPELYLFVYHALGLSTSYATPILSFSHELPGCIISEKWGFFPKTLTTRNNHTTNSFHRDCFAYKVICFANNCSKYPWRGSKWSTGR